IAGRMNALLCVTELFAVIQTPTGAGPHHGEHLSLPGGVEHGLLVLPLDTAEVLHPAEVVDPVHGFSSRAILAHHAGAAHARTSAPSSSVSRARGPGNGPREETGRAREGALGAGRRRLPGDAGVPHPRAEVEAWPVRESTERRRSSHELGRRSSPSA